MSSRTFTSIIHKDAARTYDTHTLFLKCDGCTVAGITALIHSTLASVDASLNRRFHVNVVTDMNGTSLGIAFVYVADVAIYYMLLGRNPDGSNRVAIVEPAPIADPPFSSWSSIAPALTVGQSDTIEPGASWGDICTQPEVVSPPPDCRVFLPPLLSLPPLIVGGEAKRVRVFPAVVYPVNPKYMAHILKSNDVPSWVSAEDLRAYFTPYVSDPKTYPTVTINADRTAFVTFDASTNEAQFTLHMTKKVMLVEPETGAPVVLMFNHSFRGYPSYDTTRSWRSAVAIPPEPRPARTPRKPRAPTGSLLTANRFELLR